MPSAETISATSPNSTPARAKSRAYGLRLSSNTPRSSNVRKCLSREARLCEIIRRASDSRSGAERNADRPRAYRPNALRSRRGATATTYWQAGLTAQGSQIQVRIANPGDEDRILEAYEWLFAPPGRRPTTWERSCAKRALSKAVGGRDALVLLAEDGRGELIGLCTAYLDLDSVRLGLRCWVEDLAVHPARRSRGVGSRLLAAAKSWARGRGATHLELATAAARTDAQRFYDREQPSMRSLSYTWDL